MFYYVQFNFPEMLQNCVVISVVRYLRYLDKYREYRCFDTSIEEISIYHGSHDTINCRDMTIPVSLPCNHSIADN